MGQPVTNYASFAVSPDLSVLGFGLLDGTLLLIRSKSLLGSELKDQIISLEKNAIINMVFSKDDIVNHLFYSTKTSLYCYQNLSNKKLLNQPGSTIGSLSAKNTFFFVNPENQQILEFSTLQKKNAWNFEGDKIELKCFGSNYLIVASVVKSENVTTSFNIYDIQNNYIAFTAQFTSIQHIITAYNCIFLITLSQKGEKQLFKLTEKDNNFKFETFFKRSFFDIALRFAELQGVEPPLLAEISKLHGDHLYTKGDYANAIKHYTKTAGFVEPSYIIRRFLDVSHIEYLIIYLEGIHEKKLADKHHTALLLNCYVKQKSIKKLEDFLQKSSFDSDLFDTETAIKVCRELAHTDLALKLAEQSKHDDLFLKILIEDKKDYRKALDYLKTKLELEDKIKYLREFGQTLMKNEPEFTLEFIVKIVSLSTIKKGKSQMTQMTRPPNTEETEILKYLKLGEKDWERLPTVLFPKPDEFLHLFVVNNDHLEKFLNFLKNLKNLPNEKAIFHRLFEYYLEDYVDYYNKNASTLQHRQTKDLDLQKKEKAIMDLLKEPDYESKYDQNHLLILFKMYRFSPGIVYLCEKMNLREELLNFYIENRDHNRVLELCKQHGENELDLWIQALKHFTKPQTMKLEKVEEILKYIEKIDTLSPLLILNILAKNGNIPFKVIRSFFLKKIKDDKISIEKDKTVIKNNRDKAREERLEYKKMKTTAKVFQSTRCSNCESQLTLPTVHFMCGHSFHDHCLLSDKNEKECLKCSYENKRILETKEQYDNHLYDTKAFYEKMNESNNKFDVVAEWLGKGLFR